MEISAGYRIAFDCEQETALVVMLRVHPDRRHDLVCDDQITSDAAAPIREYGDSYGNICSRILASPGRTEISAAFVVRDTGKHDIQPAPGLALARVDDLPDEVLVFLMGSRYCDTQKLSALAWATFGALERDSRLIEAIVDYAHNRITFGYRHARSDRTAFEAHEEQIGVCRDYAHLAVTLCRCMNIPARYCTGYLGDIGVPKDPVPMDFSAWFDAFIGGAWYTFDARHNAPRIGRILIARGRDAADVAISTAFGNAALTKFEVTTDEIAAVEASAPSTSEHVGDLSVSED